MSMVVDEYDGVYKNTHTYGAIVAAWGPCVHLPPDLPVLVVGAAVPPLT